MRPPSRTLSAITALLAALVLVLAIAESRPDTAASARDRTDLTAPQPGHVPELFVLAGRQDAARSLLRLHEVRPQLMSWILVRLLGAALAALWWRTRRREARIIRPVDQRRSPGPHRGPPAATV